MFSAPDNSPGSISMVGTSSRRTTQRIRKLKQSRNLGAPEFASIAQQKNMEARLSVVEVNHSSTSTGTASCSHQEEKYKSKDLLQDKKNLHYQVIRTSIARYLQKQTEYALPMLKTTTRSFHQCQNRVHLFFRPR